MTLGTWLLQTSTVRVWDKLNRDPVSHRFSWQLHPNGFIYEISAHEKAH